MLLREKDLTLNVRKVGKILLLTLRLSLRCALTYFLFMKDGVEEEDDDDGGAEEEDGDDGAEDDDDGDGDVVHSASVVVEGGVTVKRLDSSSSSLPVESGFCCSTSEFPSALVSDG